MRELHLGPDVVQRLLPHRRPFLMVDTIEAYERGECPSLHASRQISANEPVFEGHFPHMALWPGVYTIEGLGQTNNLLALLDFMEQGLVKTGRDPDLLLEGLANLDRKARLHPGYRPELEEQFEAGMAAALPNAADRMGMSARVDVKLLAPVFAGQKLEYLVTRTHVIDSMLRCEVRARVDGRDVARGAMMSTFGHGIRRTPEEP